MWGEHGSMGITIRDADYPLGKLATLDIIRPERDRLCSVQEAKTPRASFHLKDK